MDGDRARQPTDQEKADLQAAVEIAVAAFEMNFGRHPNGTGLAVSAFAAAAGVIYQTAHLEDGRPVKTGELRRVLKHLEHNFQEGRKVGQARFERLAMEAKQGATIQ